MASICSLFSPHVSRSLWLTLGCTLLFAQAANSKTIEIVQKKSKKSLQVEVMKLTENSLTFRVRNGKTFTVELDTLTEKSVSAIRATIEAEKEAALSESTAINKAIGHALFEGQDLWDEPSESVASRLGWPKESLTEQSSSFRYYTASNYKFLGAHPYCATLYGGAGGTVSQLSLVFANKGDYGSTVGSGEDHFETNGSAKKEELSLGRAIKKDAEQIAASLTSALGAAKKQYYGEKEDRRRVLRWDQGEHAFLLSEVKDEYTSLLIVDKENADQSGKVGFMKDSELKALVLKNVVAEENGDVLIKNIPMVDQGPKGYCAPATFERAMRYMLVPADMYLLATAATTSKGTNTLLLADSCKRIVRSKARRVKDLDLKSDLKIKLVKKYVDKGVPILWQMRSLKSYNQLVNQRTKERAAVSSFDDWKKKVAAEAKKVAPKMERNESNHHICMIIGYNEETNEIAVSDSWGAQYELRWVHIDVAKAVTSYGGFVIDL